MGDETMTHPVIKSYKSHPARDCPGRQRAGPRTEPRRPRVSRGSTCLLGAVWGQGAHGGHRPLPGPWVRRLVLGPAGRHQVSSQQWAARLSRRWRARPAGSTHSTRPAGLQGWEGGRSEQLCAHPPAAGHTLLLSLGSLGGPTLSPPRCPRHGAPFLVRLTFGVLPPSSQQGVSAVGFLSNKGSQEALCPGLQPAGGEAGRGASRGPHAGTTARPAQELQEVPFPPAGRGCWPDGRIQTPSPPTTCL